MAKKPPRRLRTFLSNPTRSQFTHWFVGICSVFACILWAVYGFFKGGIGLALLYGFGGLFYGAVQSVVAIASIWLLLQLIARLRSAEW